MYISAILTTSPDKTPVPFSEDENSKEVLYKVTFFMVVLQPAIFGREKLIRFNVIDSSISK